MSVGPEAISDAGSFAGCDHDPCAGLDVESFAGGVGDQPAAFCPLRRLYGV